ncbi:MAG TPA: HD domain-containing protein [Candidatus Saccharimonadales bacterium]|nr:HD domain-containing protein [Candidatus Saccharimonadales bacterium]
MLQKKEKDEMRAVENIRKTVARGLMSEEISELWHEFESQATDEAKFVKIMDKFEAVIQKNQMSFISYQE